MKFVIFFDMKILCFANDDFRRSFELSRSLTFNQNFLPFKRLKRRERVIKNSNELWEKRQTNVYCKNRKRTFETRKLQPAPAHRIVIAPIFTNLCICPKFRLLRRAAVYYMCLVYFFFCKLLVALQFKRKNKIK